VKVDTLKGPRAAHREAGSHRIGEPGLRAKRRHQARREAAPAEQIVHQAHGDPLGIRARDAFVTERDPRLLEVRPIHDHDPPLRRRRIGRRRTRLEHRPGRPAAEDLGREGEEGRELDVAARPQDRVVRQEEAPVELARARGIELRDGCGRSVARKPVAVLRIQGPREGPADQRVRVVLRLLERGERLVAGALRLAGVEARPQRHIAQDREERVQIPRQARDADGRRVPPARHRERGAEAIDGLGQRERVASSGTALHQLGHVEGEAGLRERLRRGAAPQRDAEGDPRQAPVLQHQHAHAVRELSPGEGALRDDPRIRRRRRGKLPGRAALRRRAADHEAEA
jgi:hypothetical protein